MQPHQIKYIVDALMAYWSTHGEKFADFKIYAGSPSNTGRAFLQIMQDIIAKATELDETGYEIGVPMSEILLTLREDLAEPLGARILEVEES